MAKLSTDQLIDAFKELTLIELSEFVSQFEEVFGVTAAAPVAVAAAPAAGGGDAGFIYGRADDRRPYGKICDDGITASAACNVCADGRFSALRNERRAAAWHSACSDRRHDRQADQDCAGRGNHPCRTRRSGYRIAGATGGCTGCAGRRLQRYRSSRNCTLCR